MMKIGITGANGFVAWHLRCYLHSLGDLVTTTCLADRQTFSDMRDLKKFVSGLDLVVHLAGVNRADDKQLLQGNLQPAKQLVAALESTKSAAALVYASSTHAVNPDSIYGKSKKAVSDVFNEWAKKSKVQFINLIIPHVFGEYGKPFYNSGVATFCYQIIHGEKPDVNKDGKLELVHVQDLVEQLITCYQDGFSGDYRVNGHHISVPDVMVKLNHFREEYLQYNQLPNLADVFDRKLFNCFRSFIGLYQRNQSVESHSDNRGWLVETVKAGSGGQCLVSSTHPGVVRGNHYHRRKVERFFVLRGKATIKIRKMFTDKVISYEMDGDTPSFVDIPTLYTHSITNTGNDELLTLFWSDEYFDSNNPDTYFEEVEA